MKKLIITTIAAVAVAGSAFSQGFITFSGGGSAATRSSTNSAPGGAATGSTIGAGNYYYALFASSSQTSVNGNTAAINGVNPGYVVNFLGGATPSTGWELVGIASSIASAGRYSPVSQGTTSANQGALNTDNSLSVQGIAGASTANLVSIGWSANIGTTLASLEAYLASPGFTAWVGQSAVTSQTLGDGNLTPTPTSWNAAPSYLLGEITVPEPGTLALAALGGASLLLFRRKK